MANRVQRRATGGPTYWTVANWAHARLVTVPLGDKSVDFELPDLEVYMALGKVPNPLMAIAKQLFSSGVTASELSNEELGDYVWLQCHIIADHLRKPDLVQDQGSHDKAAEWVHDVMPAAHRQTLWNRSLNHVDLAELVRTFQAAGGSAPSGEQGESAGQGSERTA
jgi:hypothetical protein